MKVTVTRTAMVGGGLAYDILVKRSDVPDVPRTETTVLPSWDHGGEYVYFAAATAPASFRAMPQGIDKYLAWLEHEKIARRQMLAIAAVAFPELQAVQAVRDDLPLLWTFGLMTHEESAQRELDITPEPCARCGDLQNHVPVLGRPHSCPNNPEATS